ncbi:MAG: helix-turn-helix transcriptional regulator [Pseudomonadales bacterium]
MKLSNYLPAVVLVLAALFFAYDIVADFFSQDEDTLHILVEMLVFIAMSLVLFRELRHVTALNRAVAEQRSQMARLSGDLMAVMTSQFDQWGLSPSESEVAMLLIKGLSMKEISELRNVKEKTVRQQATSIYAKSGYAGRHELVAHFIEDLMNAGEKNG